MAEELTKTYLFRCAPGDFRRWRADAKAEGMTFAAWMRFCLDARSDRGRRASPAVAVTQKPVSALGEVMGRVVQSSDFGRIREQARGLAEVDGKCTADVSKGVRCRLCGKTH